MECLKTGNWLKDFSIVYLKSGKDLTGFCYCVTKIRKSFHRFASLALKTGKDLTDLFHVHLKTGKGLTGFFYGVLKNRKLVERLFYCAP